MMQLSREYINLLVEGQNWGMTIPIHTHMNNKIHFHIIISCIISSIKQNTKCIYFTTIITELTQYYFPKTHKHQEWWKR